MTICSKCGRMTPGGRFCDRCGAELPAHVQSAGEKPTVRAERPCFPVAEPPQTAGVELLRPVVEPLRPVAPEKSQTASVAPLLEVDALCVLFEDIPGFVRFRFTPPAEVENFQVVLKNGKKEACSRTVPVMRETRELSVNIQGQDAGAFVWYVTAQYESERRRCRLEGEIQIVVVRPREAQKAADSLAVNITNNIQNGNASDVRVSQKALDELAGLAKAENPSDELRRIVQQTNRVWLRVVTDSDAVPALPPVPFAAVADSMRLDLGTRGVSFFASRTVTFGRARDRNDIWLRPPKGFDAPPEIYGRISRKHCFFEHRGDRVAICDGHMDEARVVHPSTCGTFCDDVRICEPRELSAGESVTLSFGGRTGVGAVSLSARACPPCRACASCPHADRRWCGDGRRPSLVMSRRDGVPETFVAMWSCFPLGEVDPSFEGVVVFRKDGAFAWRRGRRCGWLVPGESLQTEAGIVRITETGKQQ